MMSDKTETDSEEPNGGEWNPEPAELREGETEDMDAHARRNLEMLRAGREELEREREDSEGEDEDPEVSTDGGQDIPEVVIPGKSSSGGKYHRVHSPCVFHLAETEQVPVNSAQSRGFSACSSCDPPTYWNGKVPPQDPEPVADGGEDLSALASAVSETLASSDIPLNTVSVSVDEVNGDVTVQASGPQSREDWTELRDTITGTLDRKGFTYSAKEQWAFVKVTGRELETDGGVVAHSGGVPVQPDGGKDLHHEVKLKAINSPIVWAVTPAGEDGQYLAIQRLDEPEDEELEQYHLLMDLAGYTDVDPYSVLDEDPTVVSGDDLTLDLWKPKDLIADGGRVVTERTGRLFQRVERALEQGGVSRLWLELDVRPNGVRVAYTCDVRDRIADALDAAGLEYSGGSETRVGPGACDVQGFLYVSGEDGGGDE